MRLQIDKLKSEAVAYQLTKDAMCEQLSEAAQKLTELDQVVAALESLQQQLTASEEEKQQLRHGLEQAESTQQRLQQQIDALRVVQEHEDQSLEQQVANTQQEAVSMLGVTGADGSDVVGSTTSAFGDQPERPSSGTPAGSRSELAKQVSRV